MKISQQLSILKPPAWLLPVAFGLVLAFGTMDGVEAGFATIDIEKLVNGDPADTAPGPIVPVGSTVTFTYIIEGFFPGGVTGVTVRDNNGTPANAADDFSPALITNGNGDLVLDFQEVWTYSATSLAILGQYTNIAQVSGTIFSNEESIPVFQIDLGNYFGVGDGTPQVPEPATLVLLSVGLTGLAYRVRRRTPRR